MRRHAQWLLLCFVIAILAGCGSEITPSQSKVMVEVGNISITEAEFSKTLDMNAQRINETMVGQDPNTVRQQVLDQLISEKVLLAESAKLGVGIDSVTAERINQVINQEIGKEKPTYADYEAFAKANRFESNDSLRAYLAQVLTFENYAQAVKLPLESPQYHVFHILISTDTVSESIALEQTQQLIGLLNAGEDFSLLAQQYSADTGSGANGGELGWLTREEFAGFVPEFADALGKLEVGQLSAPVKTQYGYHIIKISESRDAANFNSFQELIQSPQGNAYIQSKIDEYRQNDLIKNYVRAEDVPFPESVTIFQDQ